MTLEKDAEMKTKEDGHIAEKGELNVLTHFLKLNVEKIGRVEEHPQTSARTGGSGRGIGD